MSDKPKMNNSEDQNRLDDILNAMKGAQRAQPSAELFDKIEARIDSKKQSIILNHQWKYAIAASFLLLVLNGFSVINYLQTQGEVNKFRTEVPASNYENQLVSNYEIYQ